MKLAFCLFKVFPYGGLERDFLRIAGLCHARGHEVVVFTQQWQGDISPGFKVNVVKLARRSSRGRAKEFALAVLQLLERERADAVIGFNKMPGLDLYYAADPCLQRIVPDPFDQGALNRMLFEMFTSTEHGQWRANALDYAKTTDLYSLPERAVETYRTACSVVGPSALGTS